MSLIQTPRGREIQIRVGISEMRISTCPEETLVTYSLGSCVGVAFHDAAAGLAGLIHCMLPQSSIDPARAATTPGMFVDTGLPLLLQGMFNLGASRKTLVAKVAGAANQLDDRNLFRIGDRNYAMVRKMLWKNDILISAESVGGSQPRTLHLQTGSGRTTLRSGSKEVPL